MVDVVDVVVVSEAEESMAASADEWDSILPMFRIQAQTSKEQARTNKLQTENNMMFTRRLDDHSESLM